MKLGFTFTKSAVKSFGTAKLGSSYIKRVTNIRNLMISGLTQTAAIIRLNFTRQIVRGKIKYAMVFLLAYSLLPYIIIKTAFRNYHPDAISGVAPVSPLQLFVDPINLDSDALAKLTANPQVQQMKRQDFLVLEQPMSLLLSFKTFDSQNQKYDYTLTSSSSGGSLSSLWLCITPNGCSFEPNMKYIAATKNIIDKTLRGGNGDLTMLQALSTSGTPFVAIDAFEDLFFLALSPMIIYALFEEKTKGLKFGLFMTGLFFIPMLIATLFGGLTLFMFIQIWSVPSAVGPLAVLVFCACYGYVGFAWICAQLAPNIRAATLISTVYVATGVISKVTPINSKLLQYIPSWGAVLLCVNPRFGLSTYFAISQINGNDKGFSSMAIPYSAPSINTIVASSVLFTVLLFLFGAYLNWLEVSQDETRPIHYPISRFFKKRAAVVEERAKVYAKIEPGTKKGMNTGDSVQISNLSKLYAGATTRALTDVSLEFTKGEIFGLLGYNGAGKSTFINILCGVLSATEGNVNIFGLDAKEKRYEIAARTGVCSQVDILYDDLTTKEHLFFFGLMRGVPSSQIKQTIDQIVADLHIPDHMLKSPTKVLSAGQKRKLGVALAFINDPELVVLDEMSSGVDPENRRVIWDFLLKKKQNRAILLCTHFMDEADIVCDRKAMLTLGQLVCVGSSEYLKQIYDTGYTLTVEKAHPSTDIRVIENWFHKRSIKVYVTKVNQKLVEYQISAMHLNALVDFERDGEISRAIRSYSVQENGLEQIFTNKELVDEKDITLTPQEQQNLLDHMASFVEPSFAAKTGFYMKFEMQRLFSSIVEIFFRMTLSLILIIIAWICIKVLGGAYTSSETASFENEILPRLLPSGFVLETNINGLISNNPSKFVPLGSTGSSISMGTLIANATGTVLTTIGDYDGAPLLAMSALFKNNLIASSYEYYTKVTDSTGSYESLTMVIMQLLYADFLVNLTEDIAESKEKIKFLLLSAGVPLGSYWIVIFVRSIVIIAPLIALFIAALPSAYSLSGAAAVIYLIQPLFFSALIGSVFAKSAVGGITQAIRVCGLLALLAILIVGAIENWGPAQYKYLNDAFEVLSPYLPLSVLSAPMANTKVLTAQQFMTNSIIWSIGIIVLFAGVELRHLFIRKIAAFTQSFVSFNSITKRFGKKVAVNNLNLQIEKNEMFAFLGPNGCGKTTSLSMLTAQALPTSGSVHMDGLHVASRKLEAIKRIGFCPQFDDLLIANMTVAQHLHLFCAMNGIPEVASEDYIDNLLHAFGIERFKNVNCGSLSGGTKRKVSSAIAVMLPRSLVVLDEASTGLDPLARQKLWNTVRLLNVNRTTIMTTHYISETSYCDKIAIMTDGNLQACDTEYELTKSSAQGYKATLHMSSKPDNLLEFVYQSLFYDDNTAQVEIENIVGESAMINFKQFRIPLSLLISRLSDLVRQNYIKNYTIGRMSLEDVFLDIVKKSAKETV